MYKDIVKNLSLEDKSVIVDCTVGVASHALKFLEVMNEHSFLIGIDKDQESLGVAQVRLQKYSGRFKLFKEDFRNLDTVLDNLGIEKADVFFFDLGISSFQLADIKRGFSFLNEGPLDMRMDRSAFLCACDLVNNLSESELNTIFKKFGEERFSRRIAHSVVAKRRCVPITTTTQLSSLILESIPGGWQRYKIHPATRVFQALRIAVNRELDSLGVGLRKAINHTSRGGKIAAISFHSLEDRIVKHTFREFAYRQEVVVVTKRPLLPHSEELKENNSSRSAKLRVVEKIV